MILKRYLKKENEKITNKAITKQKRENIFFIVTLLYSELQNHTLDLWINPLSPSPLHFFKWRGESKG